MVEHDVVCATCGETWQDDYPDKPGAVIWCGDCDRGINREHVIVKETNEGKVVMVRPVELLCARKNLTWYLAIVWIPLSVPLEHLPVYDWCKKELSCDPAFQDIVIFSVSNFFPLVPVHE